MVEVKSCINLAVLLNKALWRRTVTVCVKRHQGQGGKSQKVGDMQEDGVLQSNKTED